MDYMTRLYEREIKDFFEVAKIKMAGTTKEGKGKFGKICACFKCSLVYFPHYANSALSTLCSAFVLCLHWPFACICAFVWLYSNVIKKIEFTSLALMFLMKKRSLLMSKALVSYWTDDLNCLQLIMRLGVNIWQVKSSGVP